MSQIITTYPIFEGSQVLTSEQLNQLSAYLDQQNRLTRSKLIGIGIVCGMQVQPLTDGLKITKGLGITSEGFLIQIGQDFNGTHYRPYTLPEGISYKPFGFPEQDVTLFEILSSKPEDETDVKKLNDPAAFLTEKYVLLFLEIFDKDLKSCLGNACDDKGQDRIMTLRRLLISKTDLDKVLTRSANVSGGFSGAPDLKSFHFKKPLFSPSGLESNQIGPFINLYQKTIQDTATPEFWEQLQKGYTVFEPLLAKSFDFKNPFTQAALTAKITQIKQSLTDAPATIRGAQYLYDFFHELALAWGEFVETGLSLWYSCPTDPSIFPLHLMLGKAKPSTESPEEFYKYRHGFVQAPIYNEQRLLKETLAQQYRRLVLMIETFELEILKNPKPGQFPIKITPSKEKSGPLGLRSIPYYYDIKSKGNLGNWFSLEKNWANPAPQQLWSSTRGKVLGYDNQPDAMPSNPGFWESPLSYNWEAFPFLRIEGHLDYDILKAKEDIQKLINKFNLPIHLESLHLDSGGPLQDKNCGWNDLQEEYMHHRFQLLGMIRDLREILDFLQKMNEKYGGEKEMFSDKDENQVLKAFELFEIWVDAMSECLEDLDWDKFQEAYKKILQTLLDFLLIQMKLLDKMDVNDKEADKNLELINGLMARVSPLIYRILDLFYFTKIQRLFLSYLHRKSKLHNSRKFSEFLNENPGLTHEAGVYRGGTFILVYMQSSGKVIGDFSLPGAACDCQCIEACDSDDWSLLPPFARPDYAITLQNSAVSIEVMVNDRLPIKRNYIVKPLSESSEKGGKVSQDGNNPIFIYEPPKDFAGDDAFSYLLVDEDSGLSDVGRVTIWVKSPKPQTCYNRDILACWGEKNVFAAVEFRKLDPGNDLEFAIQSLLTSLQQTGGFTEEEIMSVDFLEEEESRKQLLSCLGLFQDGMDYDSMGKAILDYQAANCGASQPNPEPTCTSTRVIGRVMTPAGGPVSGAKVSVKGSNISVLTNDKGEFLIQFPNPGQTLIFEATRFISTEIEICNQENITVTLIPEKQETNTESVGVAVAVNTLTEEDLIKVATIRGLLSEGSNPDKNTVIRLMEDDKQEVTLKTEELVLLKNDTLKVIADSRDLRYRSNSNKTSLVNLITGK
ncbi:carboxypeptidase-like regulatory domain-containing protein [Algoriphagus mannitolivorans]|uniref:carboxypeptidase-like regulatory domain-containing protein n=1 Tax=Algoriphagus mannitolivorans TaxID=226504 RepID=UPI00040EB1E7|nr:carboxypeptidase-like regulatory domain-containing protein [Algoriphagus mannitolivorans]